MTSSRKPPHDRRPTFLRAWRENAGLTQAEAAALIGLDQASVGRMENLKQPYDQDWLEIMADVYGCHVSDLLVRDPQKSDDLQNMVSALRSFPELIPEIVGYIRGQISASERLRAARKDVTGTPDSRSKAVITVAGHLPRPSPKSPKPQKSQD